MSASSPPPSSRLVVDAEAVLARLAAARTASVDVRSGIGTGGAGEGTVTVGRDGDTVVVSDSGEWTPAGGRPMRWRAVSRWRQEGGALAVEHVRQGTPATAVLDCQPDGRWIGRAPHLCGDDRYEAAVEVEPVAVVVTWTMSGPCKMAQVVTRYA